MVIAKRTFFTLLTVSSFFQTVLLPDQAFGFIRVLGENLVRIKPNQPAFFGVEVARDASGPGVPFKDLMGSVLQSVTINGRVYGPGFGGGWNKAAGLLVDEEWLRETEKTSNSFQATLILFLDAEDKKLLFQEPGRYDISIGDTLRVTVVVEQPTAEEAAVVRELNDMGVEFIAWVLAQGDGHRPELARRVEKLLEAHPNTVYSEMLSVCVGASKVRESTQGAGEGGVDWDEVARRRSEAIAKYFAPYANGPFRSPFQATAAFQLATHLINFEARAQATTESDRIGLRNRAKTLLKTVAESPYSARSRQEAETELRKLEE